MEDKNNLALLNRLRKESHECEWIEFKANQYHAQEIGEYFSALANSACLLGKPRGYLVFGVKDKTHDIVGTSFNPYKEKGKGNQSLLLWLANGLQPNVGFDHHIIKDAKNNVVIFEVTPAFTRPVKFYGTAFIRVGSSKTKLSRHPEKERAIWNRNTDWSAQLCEQATIADLDQDAIVKARQEYKVKFPGKTAEVGEWDDSTFLNKTGLAVHGALIHAAILLLGRPESSSLISPAVARISWILKDEKNQEKDYEHFDPPFIMNVDRVLAKIRNLNIRQLPSGTLFPVEIRQYEPWVLREALHNCIAHQDYGLSGRINVVEMSDRLLLTNVGSFLPGSVECVIQQDAPQEIYRNPVLAKAMVNLNMIDTQGGGIKKMFQIQKKRYFPMPDYDLSEPLRVKVQIIGKVIDENYSRMLIARTDLDLLDVIALDKVQKRKLLSEEEFKSLKSKKLVEGRRPNLFVSAGIAAATDTKDDYIKKRAFEKDYYKKMIMNYLEKFGEAKRKDIDKLLLSKLSDALSEEQKKQFITNLLQEMRREGNIQPVGITRWAKWVISKMV